MILEGNERGFGGELARHLLNTRDNDHVSVHAVEGFIATDLTGAFAESEAIAQGTQCRKYLFSLSLNPPPGAKVTVKDFENAIARIEAKLGLAGQPRAIVFHEKHGRRHAHCVWSRIDSGRMRAINSRDRSFSVSRKVTGIVLRCGRRRGAAARENAASSGINPLSSSLGPLIAMAPANAAP